MNFWEQSTKSFSQALLQARSFHQGMEWFVNINYIHLVNSVYQLFFFLVNFSLIFIDDSGVLMFPSVIDLKHISV